MARHLPLRGVVSDPGNSDIFFYLLTVMITWFCWWWER